MSADLYLKPGDSGGVLGRINDVGSGYGTAPKGYLLEMTDAGLCRLIVSRGKKEKDPNAGDAEQQALALRRTNANPGGELVLGSVQLQGVHAGTWHRLAIIFQGSGIAGLVDGKQVLSASDSLYTKGMAGLMAEGGEGKLSMPYYDNLLIRKDKEPIPAAFTGEKDQIPIYKH